MKPTNLISLWALVVAAGVTAVAAPVSPPNLIVILTDDQGYHDVGFNGSRDLATPNLDSIANNGVRFASGYISSLLSSPSRASLLTGRYQERFGYEHDPKWEPSKIDSGLPLTVKTLADVLGKAGYDTGLVGKWHLGSHPALHPLKRGFDEFFGFLGAGLRYLPSEWTIEGIAQAKTEDDSWHLRLMRNNEPVKTTNYLTDELSAEAVRFIAAHKKKTFFLLVAYNAPHNPLEAPEKYLNRFPKILGPNRRNYAAMMSAVDDGVGLVLAELQRNELTEKTLVVYLAATGGALDANSSDNFPLRGSKDFLWEGGWRVPFAMQWPGHLPRGLVYEPPVLSLDIFATISELSNAQTDPQTPLDGVNLIPFLTGQKTGPPHESIFLRMPFRGAYAVRSGDYKLVVPAVDKPAELYDIATDISELKNLADLKPEITKTLQKKYDDWSRQMLTLSNFGTTERIPTLPIDSDAGKLKTGP